MYKDELKEKFEEIFIIMKYSKHIKIYHDIMIH